MIKIHLTLKIHCTHTKVHKHTWINTDETLIITHHWYIDVSVNTGKEEAAGGESCYLAVELYGETDTNVYDECNSNVVSAELSMNRIS